MSQELEQKLGKYSLIKKLAQGGMAEIFLASQEGPGGFRKQLVIKRILPHLAEDEKFVEMFLDEARIAAQFNNPNIVQIYDLGQVDSHYFIAMEFIDGFDLAQLIERAATFGKRVPPTIAARIIADALGGLHYAHEFKEPSTQEPLNLVHRDISPQNLLVNRDGVVKLVDFGVAKAKNSSNKTQTGAIKGKFSYMAPEQIAGQPLDGRCDLFAMGIVLYELLLGVRPFGEHSDLLAITAIIHQAPKNPREIDESFPPELESILNRALDKNRDTRFQDALEMQRELEMFLQRSGVFISTREVSEYINNLFSENPNLSSIGMAAGNTHALPIADLKASQQPAPATTQPAPATAAPATTAPSPVAATPPPPSMTAPTAAPIFDDPAPKKNRGLMIAVILILIGVIGGGAVLGVMLLGESSTEAPAKEAREANDPKEDEDIKGGDPVDEKDVAGSAEADASVAAPDEDTQSPKDSAGGGEDSATAQADAAAPEDSGPAVPAEGMVKLKASPSRLSAVAYLDTTELGPLPGEFPLPEGEHKVKVVVEKVHASKLVTIVVKGGETVETKVRFKKAKVNLTTIPAEGVKVIVDGKNYGASPMKTIQLWEGTHQFELEIDGKNHRFSVPVAEGVNEITLPPR